MLVVLREGKEATAQEIIEFLKPKVAKLWLPNDVLFEKEFPIGPTGKILKRKIKEKLVNDNYKFPDDK